MSVSSSLSSASVSGVAVMRLHAADADFAQKLQARLHWSDSQDVAIESGVDAILQAV